MEDRRSAFFDEYILYFFGVISFENQHYQPLKKNCMKNLNSIKAKQSLLLIFGTLIFFGIIAIIALKTLY
jgi:hypothetical protein